MIEQMNKVSIVLLNKEKEAALKSLRKIGLVHLEKIEVKNLMRLKNIQTMQLLVKVFCLN